MIYLAILRRAAPFLLLIGLVLGGYWYHKRTIKSAFNAGVMVMETKWRESDKLAEQVGREQTKLLARNAVISTEKLNEKLTSLDRSLAAKSTELRGLRDRLEAIATTPPGRDTSAPTCRSYEEQYRSGAGLLAEAGNLANEGEKLLREGALKLEALQDYSKLVRSSQEAP